MIWRNVPENLGPRFTPEVFYCRATRVGDLSALQAMNWERRNCILRRTSDNAGLRDGEPCNALGAYGSTKFPEGRR